MECCFRHCKFYSITRAASEQGISEVREKEREKGSYVDDKRYSVDAFQGMVLLLVKCNPAFDFAFSGISKEINRTIDTSEDG